MGSGTLALLFLGALAVWLVAFLWACWTRVQDARAAGRQLSRRTDELEKRIAGVEALMVSTVGQETEDFCRAMDALMDKMDAQKEELEPAPKPKPAPKEKLTLSKEYCGRYKKKGAGRG